MRCARCDRHLTEATSYTYDLSPLAVRWCLSCWLYRQNHQDWCCNRCGRRVTHLIGNLCLDCYGTRRSRRLQRRMRLVIRKRAALGQAALPLAKEG